MQLILLTPDNTANDETHVVNQLFAHGLERLHLRKPGFTVHDHRTYLAGIDAAYHARIVICSCFELWDEYELGGVHLNSAARADKVVWDAVKAIPRSCISTSYHAWQEIIDNEFPYGYVFISPVFDSISKEGYKAGIDLTTLANVKRTLAQKQRYCPGIIGLGGVAATQLAEIHRYGFDGGAVLGAVWASADPLGSFLEILQAANQ